MAPPVFGLMVVGSLKPISVMVLLWIVPAVPVKAPDVPICMPFWVWNAVWVPMIWLSWMSTVSPGPLAKMPVFWKLLMVEFSISTW